MTPTATSDIPASSPAAPHAFSERGHSRPSFAPRGVSNNRHRDSVAIIGAGPGGLATAVMLAAQGFRVTIYEAQPVIGGRTARITRGDYHFDTGPTFFLMPYVLEEIFAAAGRKMSDYVDLRRLDPMYRLVIGRKGRDPLTLDTTQDIAEMSRRIGAVNPKDGQAFARFIADNRYKLRHSESILRNPLNGLPDLFGPNLWRDTLKVAPVLAPHKSVHNLLGKYFEDEFVKLAVCFQSKYLGMSPYDCPSLFTILPFIEYEYGIWHPIGGCNALMTALAQLASELGADIRTSSPVASIAFESPSSRRATGVVVHGTLHQHDHIVMNADASHALKTLIPHAQRPTYSDQHLDSRKYSCSTFMMYLGIDGAVDLPHHTICVSQSYTQNLQEISATGDIPQDPSVYVCNPSRIDPTLAPPGKSSLYVLVPVANNKIGPVDWSTATPAFRRRTLDQLSKVLGLTSLESRIEQELIYTPVDWQRMGINHGATFNLAHNLTQMLHWRPRNRLPDTDNLYLVGGGTHPGSGLPTIFLSAQITSKLIAQAAETSR
jgi:phytoene desaturase